MKYHRNFQANFKSTQDDNAGTGAVLTGLLSTDASLTDGTFSGVTVDLSSTRNHEFVLYQPGLNTLVKKDNDFFDKVVCDI